MRVLGDCPQCGGKDQFGNVMMQRNRIIRGCMSCRYKAKVRLPDIKKKTLYLDQFFFSHAFRERDKRFVEAAQLVGRISNLQLLVAPFSSLHEDETYQWRDYDGKINQDLINFIKTTSRGHEFLPAYEVQRRQIVRAFQAFLESNSDVFVSEERDALKDDIHQWHDYFRIDVDRYLGNSELKREMKSRSVEELFRAFPEWKKSTNSFDQDVALEVQESYKNYLTTYFRDNFKAARDFDPAMFDSSFTSPVVESLVRCLPEDIPLENKWDRTLQFFKSSYFSELPYQWISARIFATLKDKVKQRAYGNPKAKKRLSGFFDDVSHIATYAPYCDAFVMDQAMASIVSDPCINLKKRYNVKVFSLNNWEQFGAWLAALEAAMSQEHRDGLAAAYP